MIGFAGLSHLGIVSSAAAAAKGFDVIAYDDDASLCAALADGKPPIAEPGLTALLRDVAPQIRYTADASDLAACDLIYISVDVPTDDANRSNLGPVRDLLGKAADTAHAGATLVILSQVRPGFSRDAKIDIEPIRQKGLHLYYQVETLVFGNAVDRALHPERFIVGCDDQSQPLAAPLETFLGAFGCPILPMRYESAELAKIAINHFLAASVAMTNTLAELCEAVSADWAEIAPALKLDRRIGPAAYLSPGLGLAGGNIERDLATVRSLAAQSGTDASVVDAIVRNSDHRRKWAIREVRRALDGKISDTSSVAVWGLAYKRDTASTKNSPALALIEALAPLPMRAYDPQARVNGAYRHLSVVDAALDACADADVLAIMTPWPEFSAVDPAEIARAMRGRVIVDPFAVLDPARCVAAGFSYSRLGSARDA